MKNVILNISIFIFFNLHIAVAEEVSSFSINKTFEENVDIVMGNARDINAQLYLAHIDGKLLQKNFSQLSQIAAKTLKSYPELPFEAIYVLDYADVNEAYCLDISTELNISPTEYCITGLTEKILSTLYNSSLTITEKAIIFDILGGRSNNEDVLETFNEYSLWRISDYLFWSEGLTEKQNNAWDILDESGLCNYILPVTIPSNDRTQKHEEYCRAAGNLDEEFVNLANEKPMLNGIVKQCNDRSDATYECVKSLANSTIARGVCLYPYKNWVGSSREDFYGSVFYKSCIKQIDEQFFPEK